jgi:uncharacterized protein
MGHVYEKVAEHFDAWQNIVTGAGTERDKTTANTFSWDMRLNDQTLEALYHNDDLAARVVDILPEHMLRPGYILTLPGNEQAAADLREQEEALGGLDGVQDAMVWGRLYGGAALFVGADDGRLPYEALDENNIKSIMYVRVIDRRDLIPTTWYLDPRHPKFGLPETFRVVIMPAASGVSVVANVVIHESRLIIFRGARTSLRVRRQNYGWDHSVLQKVWPVLSLYSTIWQSVGALVSDANQAVITIKDLIGQMADGKYKTILDRLAVMDRTRSSMRALVLDSDGEGFERKPTNFAGLPDILQIAGARLSAAFDGMPLTFLFGTSPGGLNATGESDTRNWYATVESKRQIYLGPRLKRFFTLLMLAKSGPTRGKIPDEWSIDYPSLWRMSPKEEAEVHNVQSDADTKYINAQVLTPEEIATSRFNGPEGYSLRTTINHDVREELMADDAIAAQLQKPAPAALPQPEGVAPAAVKPPDVGGDGDADAGGE